VEATWRANDGQRRYAVPVRALRRAGAVTVIAVLAAAALRRNVHWWLQGGAPKEICGGATAIRNCSVCERPIEEELHQVWISLRVATDILPLLVNACSSACVAGLPDGANDYIPTPHKGGRIDQPTSDWD
jgi:hypothetical protein